MDREALLFWTFAHNDCDELRRIEAAMVSYGPWRSIADTHLIAVFTPARRVVMVVTMISELVDRCWWNQGVRLSEEKLSNQVQPKEGARTIVYTWRGE